MSKSPLTLPYGVILLLALWVLPFPGRAAVEWEILNNLKTGSRPLDVTVSADGKSVFVLTEDGQIMIFGSDGALLEKIAVGTQAEKIAVDPEGERLYVTNRQSKRVDVLQIDVIRPISLKGAPTKGNPSAAVVIAVFSDFQ